MTEQQHIEILDSLKFCLQQMQKLEAKVELLEDIARNQNKLSQELSNTIQTLTQLAALPTMRIF